MSQIREDESKYHPVFGRKVFDNIFIMQFSSAGKYKPTESKRSINKTCYQANLVAMVTGLHATNKSISSAIHMKFSMWIQ